MSGAALCPWGIQTDPAETSRRLAYLLGCSDDADDATIVSFLREVDYKDLVRVAHFDAVPEKDKKRLFKFSFVRTPEKIVPGVETFFPLPVEQMMSEGQYHAVPYMTGTAEIEYLFAIPYVDIRRDELAKEVDANWKDSVLPELRLPDNESKNLESLDELRRFFMEGKPLSSETMKGFLDMLSDITFNEGIALSIKSINKAAKASLYQYYFTADDTLNFYKVLWKIDSQGAAHGDDLGYLFQSIYNDPDISPDCPAAVTRQRMVRLWTNFAKTGDPTPEDDPLLGVRWKPFTENERNFLEIGTELRLDTDLHAERVAFWEKFYDTYGS